MLQFLFSRIDAVEECDATGFHSSNAARFIKNMQNTIPATIKKNL